MSLHQFQPRGGGSNGSLAGGSEPPDNTLMQARVAKLEDSLRDIAIALATLDERSRYVATGADIEKVRTEIARVDGRISSLPTMAKISVLVTLAGSLLGALQWWLHHSPQI